MQRWKKRLVIFTAVVTVLVSAGYAYYHHRYPYGWSHCCDKQLINALQNYAEQHEGWYPHGEASAEASLSLLHRFAPESVDANLLRGKTIPEDVVQVRLAAGELLTPETTGWYYVAGLRADDDPRLALFWDKAGLGHNGERLSGGLRRVCFVNGLFENISGDQWAVFLEEQDRLRSAIKR